MAFNRNILYVPTRKDRIVRFDLATPAAPVALADLVLGLGVEVGSLALFSDGEIVLGDVKTGRLVRIDPAGSVVWNIDARESTEVIRQVHVDKDDNVWVGFNGGKVAKFVGGTGTLTTRVADTQDTVIQSSDKTFVMTYDDVVGRVVLIDIGSVSIFKDFKISDLSTDHEPVKIKQIGMRESKFFVPVRKISTQKYEIMEISEDVLLQLLPLEWPKPITGTLVDATGNIYAMDEFFQVFKFLSTSALFAIYNLQSQGRLNSMSLEDSAATLLITSDDFFGEGRVHALDPATGVATFNAYSPANKHDGGDLTGYQRAIIIEDPDVPKAPPVVTLANINAFDFGGPGVTRVTGLPGAVSGATTVSSTLGTVPVEADGSFHLSGGSVGPGAHTLTFTGPGGATPQIVTVVAFVDTADGGGFQGTKFGLDGGFVKMFLTAAGVPLTTGTHFIRIKENNSGLYWNGSNLVASNGLFLSLTHDEKGIWLHNFELAAGDLPEGDYTIFFEEGAFFANDEALVTKEKQDIAETLSEVKKLAEPAQAFLEPANLLTDPQSIGGSLFHKLSRLQFHLNILSSKATLVFPKVIEGIAVIVSRSFIKTNDTPLIEFTLMDSVTAEPKDLTGHTVRFRTRTQAGGLLIFDRQLELDDDPTNGKASVRLDPADTDTSGSFVAEVEDIGPDGVTLSSETFNFTINPDLT